MKIRSHSESHIVELDDGSRWQIFPGDLDLRQPHRPTSVRTLASERAQVIRNVAFWITSPKSPVAGSPVRQLDGRITMSSNEPKGATIQIDVTLDHLPS